jgi:hypothetical protein
VLRRNLNLLYLQSLADRCGHGKLLFPKILPGIQDFIGAQGVRAGLKVLPMQLLSLRLALMRAVPP